MSNEYQPTARLLSIRDLGWIEVGDSRVFLCDALGGFYGIREQMVEELGAEFAAEVFYRAGFAATERLMAYCLTQGVFEAGVAGFDRTLALITAGGYGQFALQEARFEAGWAVVTVHNGLESSASRQKEGPAGFVCDYTRGLLRGMMQGLLRDASPAIESVDCLEIACIANGDPECRFAIGTQAELFAQGYRQGNRGQASVRETLLRLNRQLEEVLDAAQKDSLTGLFNRAHFESALRHRIEFANRRTDTVALAMIDVDRFKEVNDTRGGHAVGDMALRQIADLLATQARDTDVVARYGGDEFTWLMPATSIDAAIAVAERIRRLVQDTPSISDIPLTLSIGIASFPADTTNPTALINLADVAMYRAKDEGGNRVRRYQARDVAESAPRPLVPPPGTGIPNDPLIAPRPVPSRPSASPRANPEPVDERLATSEPVADAVSRRLTPGTWRAQGVRAKRRRRTSE